MKFFISQYRQSDLTCYLELKNECSDQEEWIRFVENLLLIQKDSSFICMILNEEKRYSELMDQIKKENSVYLLDQYEKVLRKNLPEDVIEFYSSYLLKEAEHASNRSAYRYLMQYLKKINKCSGGHEAAISIAQTWKSEYKRRRAMMDELSKAGF